MLQRLSEELEYSELLDKASETEDPYERMVLIAAFAVSAYGSSHVRAGHKPFNPLLGETYECVREDKGFKYISEQVRMEAWNFFSLFFSFIRFVVIFSFPSVCLDVLNDVSPDLWVLSVVGESSSTNQCLSRLVAQFRILAGHSHQNQVLGQIDGISAVG